MKLFRFLNNIPLKQQMAWSGGLAILIAIAKAGFDTLVYWQISKEAPQTMREIGLSIEKFYHAELLLNLTIGLIGLFFLLAGLLAIENKEKKS